MSDRFLSRDSKTARVSRGLITLFLTGAALTGCQFHSVAENPPPPVPETERFLETPAQLTLAPLSPEKRWWRAFDDKAKGGELDGLVDQALTGNFDLRAGWARLSAAVSTKDQANAVLMPQLTGNASMQRSRQNIQFGSLGSQTFYNTTTRLSLGLSYDLDLWGRALALRKASIHDLRASRADIEAFAQTLAGQVTETWLGIVQQRATLELLRRQERVAEDFLALVEERFRQAAVSAVDVLQQRRQLASVRTELPPARQELAVLEHRLAVLLGRPPGQTPALQVRALPALPPLPSPGVPARLLERRPDLRAARLRVEAADERVGAAVADMLPTLRLSAEFGYQSFEISQLFDSFIGNLAAGLTAPLFDGGRRLAEIDRNDAVLFERLQQYGQAWITALQEVEDALAREREQKALLARLDEQIGYADDTLTQARERYRGGLSDYLTVLTALQTVQTLQRTRLAARGRLLSFRVQLHRALGGSWTDRIGAPKDITRELDDDLSERGRRES